MFASGIAFREGVCFWHGELGKVSASGMTG